MAALDLTPSFSKFMIANLCKGKKDTGSIEVVLIYQKTVV